MNHLIADEQFEVLRDGFKAYLRMQYPKWEESTVAQRASDAFFVYNNDLGINFWDAMANEEALLIAKEKIQNHFTHNKQYDKPANRADYYFSSIKLLKNFLDKNYSHLAARLVNEVGKATNSSTSLMADNFVQKRYWLYAPGENARLWNEFFQYGIMGIGWDDVGNLRQYPTKSKIGETMQLLWGSDKTYRNIGHALWQFANEVNPGDVVFVKRGMGTIIGRGIVTSDYAYDPARNEYKHIRSVNWTERGEWEHPGQAAMKTLTDITPYTEYVHKLEQLFTNDVLDAVEQSAALQYPCYTEQNFLEEVYISPESYSTLKGLLLRKKNVILQGAPGVGKTFAAQRLAFSIMGEKDNSRIKVIQFHQSYSYEDFVMGFRPYENGFQLVKGPFYEFCKEAESDDKEYFFIIDEINRGNLSKIFGELLMLIESDKRGHQHAIRLLYADEQFHVPHNVHIIGMMNTADRSLAMIDYALRRRFAFFDLVPAFSSKGFKQYQALQQNKQFDKLIQTVALLNSIIADDPALGKGFCIGHSYFCTPNPIDQNCMYDIVEFEILPLLNEYWFDAPSQVDHWTQQFREAIRE